MTGKLVARPTGSSGSRSVDVSKTGAVAEGDWTTAMDDVARGAVALGIAPVAVEGIGPMTVADVAGAALTGTAAAGGRVTGPALTGWVLAASICRLV